MYAIDTTSAVGKLVFGIFAALAEFERELISERTVAGLASARARGRSGGRAARPVLDDQPVQGSGFVARGHIPGQAGMHGLRRIQIAVREWGRVLEARTPGTEPLAYRKRSSVPTGIRPITELENRSIKLSDQTQPASHVRIGNG